MTPKKSPTAGSAGATRAKDEFPDADRVVLRHAEVLAYLRGNTDAEQQRGIALGFAVFSDSQEFEDEVGKLLGGACALTVATAALAGLANLPRQLKRATLRSVASFCDNTIQPQLRMAATEVLVQDARKPRKRPTPVKDEVIVTLDDAIGRLTRSDTPSEAMQGAALGFTCFGELATWEAAVASYLRDPFRGTTMQALLLDGLTGLNRRLHPYTVGAVCLYCDHGFSAEVRSAALAIAIQQAERGNPAGAETVLELATCGNLYLALQAIRGVPALADGYYPLVCLETLVQAYDGAGTRVFVGEHCQTEIFGAVAKAAAKIVAERRSILSPDMWARLVSRSLHARGCMDNPYAKVSGAQLREALGC